MTQAELSALLKRLQSQDTTVRMDADPTRAGKKCIVNSRKKLFEF